MYGDISNIAGNWIFDLEEVLKLDLQKLEILYIEENMFHSLSSEDVRWVLKMKGDKLAELCKDGIIKI